MTVVPSVIFNALLIVFRLFNFAFGIYCIQTNFSFKNVEEEG